MKSHRILLILILWLGAIPLWAEYFFTSFDAAENAVFQYNFRYSPQMGVHNMVNNYNFAFNTSTLRITGQGVTVSYYNELYGFLVRKTNVMYTATKETPIGFELTRTFCRLDPDNGTYPESGRMREAFHLMWVQHDPSVDAVGEFLPNFVHFSELMRPQLGTNDGLPSEPDILPRSFWASDLAFTRNSAYSFSNLTPPSGSGTHDLSALFLWGYDDNYGRDLQEGAGGTINWPNFNNNNVVRFRVTIDGEYAYFYVNPNPTSTAKTDYNGTARPAAYYSNQFYFVGKVAVNFSNNLVPVFGVSDNRLDGEMLSYHVDDMTIRTVAASNVAEISPVQTRAGTTNALRIAIHPWFSTVNEAGVQEVYIDLPDAYLTYTNWTAFTNALGIFWAQTNAQAIYRTFGKTYGDANPAAGNVSISVKEGGKRLKIRFNAAASPDVFHPNYSGFGGSIATTHQYMIYIVVSNFSTPTAADLAGKTIQVYVNNEKYIDTTWTANATTGPARAYAGNVTAFSGFMADNNTLTFSTADDPVGVAAIRPNFTYEGESKTWFVDIAAKNASESADNNADIVQVDIYLPPGFEAQPGSFASERLTNVSSIAYDSASRRISVYYTNENKYLIAGSGIDTIRFNNISTTNLDTIPPAGTNQISNSIVVVSYAALPGTKPVTNVTSPSYPLQSFLIRKKPPKVQGAMLPTEVSNTLVSNSYTYLIQNKADNTGNNIRRLLIRLDKIFTNVANVVADRPATITVSYNITNDNITNTDGYWWILVDYAAASTNVVKGASATVTFWAYDTAPSLTNDLYVINIAYADNFNGDGWIAATEEPTTGWVTKFYTPPASVRSYIGEPLNEDGILDAAYNHHRYTDREDSFLVRLRIKNWGEPDNNIYKVRVTFPDGITNIDSASSLRIGPAHIRTYTTNSGQNWVAEFFYTNSSIPPTEVDDLIFWIRDDIHAPTTRTIQVEAANTTNYALGGLEGADNLDLRFIYPRPSAVGYVIVPDGFIDSATNEATIYYAISNTGNHENQIKELYLWINTNYITNIQFISSSLGGTYTGFVPDTPPYYRLQVQYYTTFYGSSNELLTFKVFDQVENRAEFPIYFSVSNVRMWSNQLPAPVGQTQTVKVIPPPAFYAYGIDRTVVFRPVNTGETNTVTVRLRVTNLGWGSNKLHKLRLWIPFGLTNQLQMVSNAFLERTNEAAGPVRLVASNLIEISYIDDGKELPAGSADDTYLTFGVFTNQSVTGHFILAVANNSLDESMQYQWTNYWTNIAILSATNILTVVDPARFYVQPTVIATPATSTVLSNRIENGTEPAGRRIRRVEIIYDDGLITNINVLNAGSGGSATVIGGTNVRIDYTPALDPNSGRWIVVRVFDNWLEGNTNMLVTAKVWYEADPLGEGESVLIKEAYTNVVDFENPAASAQGYVTPSVVWQDFPSTNYTLIITNTGDTGNDIKWVKIEAPGFIMSMDNVVSSRGGVVFAYPSEIHIYYTNIIFAPGETDTITWRGFDNITDTEVLDVWRIYANNTLQDTLFQSVGIVPGQSQSLTIKRPAYQVNYYVEFTNSINTSQRNRMYVIEETNFVKIFINNTGSTGNDILAVRVPIPSIYDATTAPDNLMITNDMIATSLKGTVVISNDSVWVDYSGSPLLPMDGDEVLIVLRDRIDHYETNLIWTLQANLNTTADQYKDASIQVGQSATAYYVMPSPQAVVTLSPSEVYLERRHFWLGLVVSNTGQGTSDLDQIEITLPLALRTGFDVSRVSNTTATGTNYTGGVLTLSYTTPIKPGEQDVIYLLVTNTASSVNDDITLGITVRNFARTASAAGNTTLAFSTLPTYYVYVNKSEANQKVNTTTMTNIFSVNLDNSVNTALRVGRVRVVFPDWFTNGDTYQSERYITNTAHITGDPTNIVVEYALDGRRIVSGDYDVLNFRLWDDRRIGNFTNIVEVYVDDGLALDESTRWIKLPVASGKTNRYIFEMPPTETFQSITTTTIYVDTEATNTTIRLTNRATLDNPVAMARIVLPVGITNIESLTSSKGSASYDADTHRIVIDYRPALLEIGQMDEISFGFSNLYRIPTNVGFYVDTANLTNEADMVFTVAPGINGSVSLLKINYPPVAVEGGFYGDNRVYLIDTNATLIYRVLNRTFESVVTQVVITFEKDVTNYFSEITLGNTVATVTRPDTNTNQFVLSYTTANGIKQGYYEDLVFTLRYNLSNTEAIPITTRVWLEKTGPDGTNVNALKVLASNPEVNILYITNANWGVVRGSVFPTNRTVNVKIYTPGSSTPSVDIDGQVLSTSTRVPDGTYVIRKIPDGTYDIEFSASYYRSQRYRTNIQANVITEIPQIPMRNAPLLGGEDEAQSVECYEDTNTMIVFPGGSVGREFSVDITRIPLTPPQKRNLTENKTVRAPSTTDDMYGYRFSLNTRDDKPMDGAIVKRDAILYLAYDPVDIASRGWSEQDLAIYYWDDNGLNPRWVRVGGEVDTSGKRVVARVSYVHSIYGVFSRAGEDRPGVITAVTLRPKVFTPSRSGDGYYGSIRVTMEFRQAVERYEVKIFDLKGNLIRRFIREDGPYTQGEIAWDGKDTEGYDVKNGVYIYKIYAGGETYSGTLVIAR